MWLKWSWWSCAIFFSQKLVLRPLLTQYQARLRKSSWWVSRGLQVLSLSGSSSRCIAQFFGLKIRLENFERSPFPWDIMCFLALLEPKPQCRSKGFSHCTLLFEMKTKLQWERGYWMCLSESKPNIFSLYQLRFELSCRARAWARLCFFQAAWKKTEAWFIPTFRKPSSLDEIPLAALVYCICMLGGLKLFPMAAERNQKWDG